MNENKVTPREIRGSKMSMEHQKRIGQPSYNYFVTMIENNLIRDCPITTQDIKCAIEIYGKDPTTLKGKTK